MRAGQLRHRVTIQQKTETRSGTGDVVVTWSDVAQVWAANEPLRGREYLEAKQVHDEAVTRFRIRHYDGILPEMRVTWTDPNDTAHTYDVVDVRPVDWDFRQMHLYAREIT